MESKSVEQNEVVKKSFEKKAAERALLAAQEKDKRRSLWIRAAGITAIIMAIVGGIVLLSVRKPQATTLPGKEYPIVGREHIEENSPRPTNYNSNPPSSGSHFGTPANWGIYTSALPDQRVIHNMEHGGIWISYKNAADKELTQKLTSLVQRYSSKVVLTPRTENPTPIALASWGWVQLLDKYNEKIIVDFINAHKNKGPEYVPDMGL